MHRRRHYGQQRRRAPCAQAEPRVADIAPAGPYIDLSNPSAPKLVGGGVLPAGFQEFENIMRQQAGDAARQRAAAAAEPCDSPALQLPALSRMEPVREPLQLMDEVGAPAHVQPATEPALPVGTGQYRTREENLVEIARLTGSAAPPPAYCRSTAGVPQARPVQYEVRHNWFGRAERWYTAEEVSRHRALGDLWLVVHGKVYDATEWVEMHPGGSAALLRRGGLDASQDFDFHTKRARGLWEATCIGRLDHGSHWLAGWLTP